MLKYGYLVLSAHPLHGPREGVRFSGGIKRNLTPKWCLWNIPQGSQD